MMTLTELAAEEDRAILCIEELVKAHGIGVSEGLADVIATADGSIARESMLRAFGYVPSNPEAWARMKASEELFPTGIPGCGF